MVNSYNKSYADFGNGVGIQTDNLRTTDTDWFRTKGAVNNTETTATKYLKELEKLGLVEKKRMGLACGNILYVKNFISPDLRDKALITLKNLGNGSEDGVAETAYTAKVTTNSMASIPHEASKISIAKEIRGNESQDSMGNETTVSYGYVAINNEGNGTTVSAGQNNNNINNNKYINIQSNPISDDDKIYMCYRNRAKRVLGFESDEMDKMSKYKIYKTAICDQVNYDALEEMYPDSADIIRNLVDVMVEIMMSTQPKFMISGNEYDADYVKSRVCSAFRTETVDKDILMGRNYDFKLDKEQPGICVLGCCCL